MSLRALKIAHAVFGESIFGEFDQMAAELDRSRGEVARLTTAVKQLNSKTPSCGSRLTS